MLILVLKVVTISSYNVTDINFTQVLNDSSTKTNNFEIQSERNIEKEEPQLKEMITFSIIGFLIILLTILLLLSYGFYLKIAHSDDQTLIIDDAQDATTDEQLII